MWFIRKILAYVGIRRTVAVQYHGGLVLTFSVKRETRDELCFFGSPHLGVMRPRDVWVKKTSPDIGVYWSDGLRRLGMAFKALPVVAWFAVLAIGPVLFPPPPAGQAIGIVHINGETMPFDFVGYREQLADGLYTVVNEHGAVIHHLLPPATTNWLHFACMDDLPSSIQPGQTFRVVNGVPLQT